MILLPLLARAEQVAPEPPGRIRGDYIRGEALAKLWCVTCHSVRGAKTGADAGPSFT